MAAVLSVLVACGTPPPTTSTGDEFKRITILDEDDADGRLAYYLIERNQLSFAGGLAAMRESPETTQPLDAETMVRIIDAIRAAGWLDPTPPSGDGDGPRALSIDLDWRGGRRTFRVEADGRRLPAGSDAVVTMLKRIADRRFEEVIDSLPRGR